MRGAALAAAVLLATAGLAQAQDQVARGTGALLRGVDKVDGDVVDVTLAAGEQAEIGRLAVELGECRYPQGSPGSDAYAYLTIRAVPENAVIFDGWMIASSPAINALEHPRYDVWVLRCSTD